jgi:hypothetical protein
MKSGILAYSGGAIMEICCVQEIRTYAHGNRQIRTQYILPVRTVICAVPVDAELNRLNQQPTASMSIRSLKLSLTTSEVNMDVKVLYLVIV